MEQNPAERIAELQTALDVINRGDNTKTSVSCERIANYVTNNTTEDPIAGSWGKDRNEYFEKPCCACQIS